MRGPVAQRLEQRTHNPSRPGSNPGGPICRGTPYPSGWRSGVKVTTVLATHHPSSSKLNQAVTFLLDQHDDVPPGSLGRVIGTLPGVRLPVYVVSFVAEAVCVPGRPLRRDRAGASASGIQLVMSSLRVIPGDRIRLAQSSRRNDPRGRRGRRGILTLRDGRPRHRALRWSKRDDSRSLARSGNDLGT